MYFRCAAASFKHHASVSGWPVCPLSASSDGMRQRQNFLLFWLVLGPYHELYIHGIGVADRDSGLKPAELRFPDASERIRSGFEAAKIVRHPLQIIKARGH